MWLRTFNALGLTNLSNKQVELYYQYVLDRKSSKQNMLLFFLALFIGFLSMFVGWYFGANYITVLPPIMVMLVFIWLSVVEFPEIVSDSRFHDSIYFLGFLFTLIALVFSLMDFKFNHEMINGVFPVSGYEKTVESSMSRVISKFGVALGTTIIGLTAKIYFTNYADKNDLEIENTDLQLAPLDQVFQSQIDNLSHEIVKKINDTTEELYGVSNIAINRFSEIVYNGSTQLNEATSQLLKSTKSMYITLEEQSRMIDSLSLIQKSLFINTKEFHNSMYNLVDITHQSSEQLKAHIKSQLEIVQSLRDDLEKEIDRIKKLKHNSRHKWDLSDFLRRIFNK